MNTKKGLSQVLVLIVAAAVLMMVGLMLVQLFSQNTGQTTNTVKKSACAQAIENKCRTTNAEDATAPVSCDTSMTDLPRLSDDASTVDCS